MQEKYSLFYIDDFQADLQNFEKSSDVPLKAMIAVAKAHSFKSNSVSRNVEFYAFKWHRGLKHVEQK